MFKRLIIAFFAFTLAACSIPGFSPAPSSTPAAVAASNALLIVAPPGSTATATPFLPVGPTPTYLPTNNLARTPAASLTPMKTRTPISTTTQKNPWGSYAGPTVWPDIDVPPPMGLLPQPDGQINILLLGSDKRPNEGGFRTDTILLITINPELGTVNITSFPRDLYVYIPGWTIHRINTAMGHGGFKLLAETMEYNFGVRPTHYAMINHESFKQVIDSLGGIDVQVARSLTDHRAGYGSYTVSAGLRHFDGETALWYVRSRYSTNDFDRNRRQQEVIKGIAQRFLSFDIIAKAPQLYDTYKQNVETNISLEFATSLLPVALKLTDTSRVNQYYISPSEVISYRNANGSSVLLPKYDLIKTIMMEALNSNK